MIKRILIVLLNFGPIAWAAQGHALRKFELRAESPQFWKLLDREAKLARVGTGFGFTEGPVWDPHGFLYVPDYGTLFITATTSVYRLRTRIQGFVPYLSSQRGGNRRRMHKPMAGH